MLGFPIIRDNQKKEEDEEGYFSCPNNPYNLKLSEDPYKDLNNKYFNSLKDKYTSMEDYKNVIEPLFHAECEEPLRQFNKRLNKGNFNYKSNAVIVDVKEVKNENCIVNNSISSFNPLNSSTYKISLTMPNYFLLGYNGMEYNPETFKNKETRSSGIMKKQDLLYLAKVSDDFQKRYFETLIFFDDPIKLDINEEIDGNIISYSSSSSSSSISDSDDDEEEEDEEEEKEEEEEEKEKEKEKEELLQKINLLNIIDNLDDNNKKELMKKINFMRIIEHLNPETKITVCCKNKMTYLEYISFLSENSEENRKRGKWICYHIMSFGPIKKEYNTLVTLTKNPSLPICKVITSGDIKSFPNNYLNTISNSSEFTKIANKVIKQFNLNLSQANILKYVRYRNFSLVKGPPGTGKTTIIIAIIVALLEESYVKGNSFKILVCAPSNYSCDEISSRLKKEEKSKDFVKSFRYKADDKLSDEKLKKKLNDTNVIVCTLCCSGNSCMKELKFDLLIIDEACQCSELTALIPFCYDIKRCILIGDPKQFPPTIKSQKIEKCGYGKSLFERIEDGSSSNEIYLLNTQYHMHPNINVLTSKYIYDGKIINAPIVKSEKWKKEWNKDNDSKFGPVRFYQVNGTISNNNGSSFNNEEEATQVINFISELLLTYPNICFHKKISIISPYSAQVLLIKKKLRELYKKTLKNLYNSYDSTYNKTLKFYDDNIEIGSDKRYRTLLKDEDILNHINVSTVDGFEGKENDIVILSMVRCDKKVGFLKDKRRLNVSISRARYSLIIFGDVTTLILDNNWKNIITEIINMGCLKQNNIIDKFYESDRFPLNILLKKFFESLKKKIKNENNDNDVKNILSNTIEYHISEEVISSYKVPDFNIKKLEKKEILLPSHIIGYFIQEMISYDLYDRLEPFTYKFSDTIKNVVEENKKNNYFWLSNTFELKSIIESIYENKKYKINKTNNDIMSNILKNLKDLVTFIYKEICIESRKFIEKETELKFIFNENYEKNNLFDYLEKVNEESKYFYIEDSIRTQLLENCTNLICTSLMKNFKDKFYSNDNISVNTYLLLNSYINKIQNYIEYIKIWCINNQIYNSIWIHDTFLQIIKNNNLYLLVDDIINNMTFSELKIPVNNKIKKIKIKVENVPNTANFTREILEFII